MRDHVVEAAGQGLELLEGTRLQLDIRQLERVDEPAAPGDRPLRRVDAHETSIRQLEGHRDEVAAVAAAELQHPAALDRRWLEPEQGGERGEPVGVRLGERMAWIGNGVVEAGARRARQRLRETGHLGISHLQLLVLLDVPARLDRAAQRPIRLLLLVLDLDLREVQRYRIDRSHVAGLRACGLVGGDEDVREREGEEVRLGLARAAAGAKHRVLEVLARGTGEHEVRARLREAGSEVEVLYLDPAGTSAAAAAVRYRVRLAPRPGLDIDLVLVLRVGALAGDPVDLEEVVDCHAFSWRRVP